MRAFLLGAVAALGLCPAIASAVVNIRTDRIDANPGETVDIEVFGENPDTAEDERLNAFTIVLRGPTFSSAGGTPRFGPPAASGEFPSPTAHPYVFEAFPGNGPVDPAGLSDFQTAFLSAALGGAGQEVNLTDARNGFGRINVIIPVGTAPGFYPVVIDPDFLALGSAGTALVAVPMGGGGINVVPEPASLGLLAIGGLLALRRRRVA